MKIVHIQLRGPYTDNWGYQENLLTRCQARLGDEVIIIAQNEKHLNDGRIVETSVGEYFTDDGVKVIRIGLKEGILPKKVSRYLGAYTFINFLRKECPHMIFVHGLFTSYLSVNELCIYKKENPKCVIVADSHEYGFGLKEKGVLYQLFVRALKRIAVKKSICNYSKVLCTMPKVIEFTQTYYKVPSALIEEMPLGYDDNVCDISIKDSVSKEIRAKLNIGASEIVIVHGGKIIPRRRTDLTIKAVRRARENHSNIRLVIFGEISDDIKGEIDCLIRNESEYIVYLGHLSQDEYTKVMLASNFAIFPGAPSVLWQEAIGCGLLLLLCKNNNADYLDKGGNVIICDEQEEALSEAINNVVDNKLFLDSHNYAILEARQYFSYTEMAKELRKMASNA